MRNKINTIPNWINNQNKMKFIEYYHKLSPNTVFFLYNFLGDGFNINKESYLKNIIKYQKINPDFNIAILRNKFDCLDQFVIDNFSDFGQMYQNYPKNIQRCDIIRYMLMYQLGGCYSDLDVIPNIRLSDVLQKFHWANVIFGIGRRKPIDKCRKTTQIETIREGVPENPTRIANYFFISRIPNHPIWIDILKLAKKRSIKKVVSQYGIIYTTGPDLVTTALELNKNKYNDIAIISYDIFTKFFKHQCSSFSDGSWRKSTNLPIGQGCNNTI